MRWLRDIVALAGLLALGYGLLYLYRQREAQDQTIQAVAEATRTITQQLALRGTTKGADINERGWPTTVDAAWFDIPPVNTLVGRDHPWIEIAGPQDAALMHPRVRVAVDDQSAGFWYNPYQGVVRARVPVMLSDEEAVRVYNQINSSTLATIFWKEPEAPPLALATKTEPAKDDAAEPAKEQRIDPFKSSRHETMSVTVKHTSKHSPTKKTTKIVAHE